MIENSTVEALKTLSNPHRLQILEWIMNPTQHFPSQRDGDLVEDGVCRAYHRKNRPYSTHRDVSHASPGRCESYDTQENQEFGILQT